MSRGKRFFLIGLMITLMVLSTACNDDADNVPDVGEETLDELAEEAVDAVETGVSALCKACTFANGEDSDSCTGVCK